jgi:hypothetical protein
MIHVDMGDDGFIGFPMSMVDRVEKAGKDVYVPPSSKTELRRNQMIEGATSSDSGEQVSSSYNRDPMVDRDYSSPREAATKVEVDEHGMSYIPAFPGSAGARGKMRVTGRVGGNSPLNRNPEKGLVGTRRLGMHQIIGEITPDQQKGGVQLVRPQLMPTIPVQPPPSERQDEPLPEDSSGDD